MRGGERERMRISLSRPEHTCTWGSSKALSCDSRECELPVVVKTQKQKETDIKREQDFCFQFLNVSISLNLQTFEPFTGRKEDPSHAVILACCVTGSRQGGGIVVRSY